LRPIPVPRTVGFLVAIRQQLGGLPFIVGMKIQERPRASQDGILAGFRHRLIEHIGGGRIISRVSAGGREVCCQRDNLVGIYVLGRDLGGPNALKDGRTSPHRPDHIGAALFAQHDLGIIQNWLQLGLGRKPREQIVPDM
jgi:hypothetical protein